MGTEDYSCRTKHCICWGLFSAVDQYTFCALVSLYSTGGRVCVWDWFRINHNDHLSNILHTQCAAGVAYLCVFSVLWLIEKSWDYHQSEVLIKSLILFQVVLFLAQLFQRQLDRLLFASEWKLTAQETKQEFIYLLSLKWRRDSK